MSINRQIFSHLKTQIKDATAYCVEEMFHLFTFYKAPYHCSIKIVNDEIQWFFDKTVNGRPNYKYKVSLRNPDALSIVCDGVRECLKGNG